MILKNEFLTKSTKKGRTKAISLLYDLAKMGGLPEPHYEYEAGGSVKRRSHFYKVRFPVPEFLRKYQPNNKNVENQLQWGIMSISGAGRCTSKASAKSLAALEVVHKIQEEMGLPLGQLKQHLETLKAQHQQRQDEIESTPVDQQIGGVSWSSVPIDPLFTGTNRLGRIQFFPELIENRQAFIAAKALTLSASERLPEIVHHANHTDVPGELQRFVNIRRSASGKGKPTICGPTDELAKKITDKRTIEIRALERAHHMYQHWNWTEETPTSFGMAKLFTGLPTHQFAELEKLLDQVETSIDDDVSGLEDGTGLRKKQSSNSHKPARRPSFANIKEDQAMLESRLRSFRDHQKKCSLPVDSVEGRIPHDADVTILQGGTGSGKTTRYPLMLSLFSPTGPRTKVLVAQPRRLACQTAARRVAFEQDTELGSSNCPIGYSIRFESFHPTTEQRTVQFQTPGVILRRAMDDPLLQEVTHLVLDEIHERNADMDLLVALAKEAQKQRAVNDPSNPLRVILMSATLDSSHWESYFKSSRRGKLGDTVSHKNSVVVVDVPDARRFPIDIVHLGDSRFPSGKLNCVRQLLTRDKFDDYDAALCEATAQLAAWLVEEGNLGNGSILCFLPGIDEIRAVDKMVYNFSRKVKPVVRYLHSSLSSKEQARIFEPGPKIILSTNIAETSVTIPDVKVVIDSGRERQFSMLDDSSMAFEGMSVVGSQLATVNISKAAAQQRAGRSGRVSAGTCYRLYSRQVYETKFVKFTKPEMLRMDLSQLVLHCLALYHPDSGHPLELLLSTPDPPDTTRVQQTINSLELQGFVKCDTEALDGGVEVTPLGHAVNSLPTSPRIGRMLFMGLVVRAIDPALQIAALLSVPKVFLMYTSKDSRDMFHTTNHTSDVIRVVETYQKYLAGCNGSPLRATSLQRLFSQVSRVEGQLKHAMMSLLKQQNRGTDLDWSAWNSNHERLAALAALVCNATPHIAHLVNGSKSFATRDVAGTAKMHPSSINFSPRKISHWYLYNELRITTAPYLHITTAASPLELALFTEATTLHQEHLTMDIKYVGMKDWLFISDQWVPVSLSRTSQRKSFLRLRRLLTHDMLQEVAQDATRVLSNPVYSRITLFVLSALEQQRLESHG